MAKDINNISGSEIELILCCTRTSLRPGDAERIGDLLRQPINWEHLMRTASSHCVLTLLCSHLKAFSLDIPPAVWNFLQSYSQENAKHSFQLTRELLRLLKLFESQNILMVPLKGPVLAASAYGNLSLRQFGDLDVLVHKRDIVRAKKFLLENGYRLQVALTQSQETAHLHEDNVFDFIRNDEQVPLEMHWAITAPCIPFPLDLDRLEGRIDRFTLAGTEVPNIAAEELLVILCVHGTKHIWGRLSWICDIAELVHAYPNIDWERVLTQAQILKVSKMVALGLQLAHEVLDAPLPASVKAWISSQRVVASLALEVRQRLFSEENHSRMEDDIFLLQAIEHLPGRLAYALHLAVTPSSKERALIPLPASLNFLWFLIRPVRLLTKYTWKAIVAPVNLAGQTFSHKASRSTTRPRP